MKTTVQTKKTRVAKRNLFAELGEGMAALAGAREGKLTLRTHPSVTHAIKSINCQPFRNTKE